MIDLYYWPTPNGHKITLLLHEASVEYEIKPINISRGAQFEPDFLKIAPNNRIPAIVDHAPTGGGPPLSVFESGAILLYLADKWQRFIPQSPRLRVQCLEWLFWQMGGLGPMAGQNHHFVHYAPERIPYAMDRYINETARLYGVLNKHLSDERLFVVGDEYTIADMAVMPWILCCEEFYKASEFLDMPSYTHMNAWVARMKARPAVMKGLRVNGLTDAFGKPVRERHSRADME